MCGLSTSARPRVALALEVSLRAHRCENVRILHLVLLAAKGSNMRAMWTNTRKHFQYSYAACCRKIHLAECMLFVVRFDSVRCSDSIAEIRNTFAETVNVCARVYMHVRVHVHDAYSISISTQSGFNYKCIAHINFSARYSFHWNEFFSPPTPPLPSSPDFHFEILFSIAVDFSLRVAPHALSRN